MERIKRNIAKGMCVCVRVESKAVVTGPLESESSTAWNKGEEQLNQKEPRLLITKAQAWLLPCAHTVTTLEDSEIWTGHKGAERGSQTRHGVYAQYCTLFTHIFFFYLEWQLSGWICSINLLPQQNFNNTVCMLIVRPWFYSDSWWNIWCNLWTRVLIFHFLLSHLSSCFLNTDFTNILLKGTNKYIDRPYDLMSSKHHFKVRPITLNGMALWAQKSAFLFTINPATISDIWDIDSKHIPQ